MSDKEQLTKALDDFKTALTEKVQKVKEAVEKVRLTRQEQEDELRRNQ